MSDALMVKYVGPKDSKKVGGQNFFRLRPTKVNESTFNLLVSEPTVFLPADEPVPDEVLAQRAALGDAMIRAGQHHVESYTQVYYETKAWKGGKIDPETGLPDDAEQKKLDALAGAQGEIDFGKKQISDGEKWNAKVAAEADSPKRSRASVA